MRYSSTSIPGPRGENQDALLLPIEVEGSTWCAVADGVGSSVFGGLAAQKSIEIVEESIRKNLSMPKIYSAVRSNLIEYSVELEAKKSISSTLTILRIQGNHAFVGHVGDTRVTHYRGSGVMVRTKDQTEVQKLLDDGVLTKNQAPRYPRRNVLLSAMSSGQKYDLQEQDFSIEKNDRILLSTDGFHTKIKRRRLAEISSSSFIFEGFWSAIQNELSATKLEDDASCIAIEIE